MAQTTFKYNPSQQSPEELEQTFVGRRELLEGILSDLREQPKGSSRQHYVIIGPRGVGKTNLLLMIHYSITNRSELSERWIPVQLAEESYSILSLADFLLETLRALSEEVDGLADQIADISASNDDQAVIDRSMDLLRKIADTQSKGILVLVDNLDMILEDQMRDQMEIHRLRSILMAQDFITIIGTSPTLFNEITNYDSPLYNFFKTINLKELTSEETEELIAKRLAMEGKPEQAEALAQYRPRLQAIRHLTGGNPRLLLMLYQICEHGAIPEVKQALEALLDELTPYFKHRMESLAPQMRKVLDTLARSDSPLTPSEVAKEARLDVKQVSVQLARMKDEGLVTAAPVRGKRNTYYSITERLFKIWHKMRLSRKDRNQVYYLAEFFQSWYQADEMVALITGLGEQFREVLADGDEHGAQRLLESLRIVELASKDSNVRGLAITHDADMLSQLGKPGEAADKLEELTAFVDDESYANLMTVLAGLRVSAGQWGPAMLSAEKAFVRLREPDKEWYRSFWSFRGVKGLPADGSGTLLFNTVCKALGATDRNVELLSTILHDTGATPDTWLCFGLWLCALCQFAAASVAYRTSAEKALANNDPELAQMADLLRVASFTLAERMEPKRSTLLQDAAANLPALPPNPDLWEKAFAMIRVWSGIQLAVHGYSGLARVPKVDEVNSPLDVILRGIADAAALKNAENTDYVAAQIGDERREIAERWIADLEAGQPSCLKMATLLGLQRSDRDPERREITLTFKTPN